MISVIDKSDALQYEAAKASIFMSFVHRLFPGYFQKKCDRRYNRYLQFIKTVEEQIETLEKIAEGKYHCPDKNNSSTG